MSNLRTKTITNWGGRLTRYDNGDMDSGLCKYSTTFGNDPFTQPNNLTWFEQPTQIDPNGAVITDLIVAARPRLESGVTYVYAIGHTGRLYKIQVNDPTTYNPNYDNPVLLATLASGSPTFKFGASIQFYGATEKIFIGHDKGVTKILFSGAGETFVGLAGSYTANVPRPSNNFLGKLYFGNGNNLVEIDSTETVTSYTRLSPGFPAGTQVRDIDVSPDGNYLSVVVSSVSQADMTTATQDTAALSSGESYLVYWNGIDTGYNSYFPYNSYSINSNIAFGPYSYTIGYDLGGAAIYSGGAKKVSLPNSLAPNFNSVFSTAALVAFASPEYAGGVLQGSLLSYGAYDEEIPSGLYRFFRKVASGTSTNVTQMPYCGIVSNLYFGSSSAGYAGNQVGSAKLYFSTLETNASPATAYKFYKFTTFPTGLGTPIAGVYETQTEFFSKKVKVSQVRIYTESLVANNSFTVALVDSDGLVISGSSETFTVGTNATAGDVRQLYNPQMQPVYGMALRVTNAGTKNIVIQKIEIDYSDGGI